jgi:hypothetical protein
MPIYNPTTGKTIVTRVTSKQDINAAILKLNNKLFIQAEGTPPAQPPFPKAVGLNAEHGTMGLQSLHMDQYNEATQAILNQLL